ncbi:MAG: hypothetical protein Q8O00_10680, partial [Holophaga sp.]|nr:hypothetical protein [Holophaga sp.]
GTLEEKIDAMLESKRDLADRVVGSGEGWLTELDDDALRRLVALDTDVDLMTDEDLNLPSLSIPPAATPAPTAAPKRDVVKTVVPPIATENPKILEPEVTEVAPPAPKTEPAAPKLVRQGLATKPAPRRRITAKKGVIG